MKIQHMQNELQLLAVCHTFPPDMPSGDAIHISFSNDDDDQLIFMEEENDSDHTSLQKTPWLILIADDDHNVHETTTLALNGSAIHGRPLHLLHAYSAREALTIIENTPDLSLVLLDVVMETVDAGLKLVNVVRNELKNPNLRIVLRTGQPGYAPEYEINKHYAVDGYTTKAKLTRSLLLSVLSDTLGGETNPSEPYPN